MMIFSPHSVQWSFCGRKSSRKPRLGYMHLSFTALGITGMSLKAIFMLAMTPVSQVKVSKFSHLCCLVLGHSEQQKKFFFHHFFPHKLLDLLSDWCYIRPTWPMSTFRLGLKIYCHTLKPVLEQERLGTNWFTWSGCCAYCNQLSFSSLQTMLASITQKQKYPNHLWCYLMNALTGSCLRVSVWS